jgi:hypothetical protein
MDSIVCGKASAVLKSICNRWNADSAGLGLEGYRRRRKNQAITGEGQALETTLEAGVKFDVNCSRYRFRHPPLFGARRPRDTHSSVLERVPRPVRVVP